MGGRRGLRRGKQPSRGDSECSPPPRLRFRLPWLGTFRSRMGPGLPGCGTDLKPQLAPAGRRGFGLQAEVFFFSSLWLDTRRPGDRRHGRDFKFPS